jgi:predicted DNA-binding protein
MTIKEVTISAHIPQDLANKLQKVSQFEERSKSYYIKKSLERYLSEKLEDIEDYIHAKKSYEEFKASGEEAVSFDEVFKDIK